MSDILFIVNLGAGNVARDGSILTELCAEGIDTIEPDFDRLDDQLRPYLGRVRSIAIEGGDGTVTAVVGALLRISNDSRPLPDILIVSGGTTNLIASALGTTRSKRKIEALLRGRGSVVHMPALHVHDAPDSPPRTGFFLASGSIARTTKYCRDVIHENGVRGMVAVIIAIASSVLGSHEHRKALLAPTEFEAQTDDTRVAPSHRFSIVTTLPRLTGRFVPFWGEGNAPINLLVAAAQSRSLAYALCRCALGIADLRLEKDGYISRRTSQISVAHRGPYDLDGESFTSDGLTVTASRPIPFRVPA